MFSNVVAMAISIDVPESSIAPLWLSFSAESENACSAAMEQFFSFQNSFLWFQLSDGVQGIKDIQVDAEDLKEMWAIFFSLFSNSSVLLMRTVGDCMGVASY